MSKKPKVKKKRKEKRTNGGNKQLGLVLCNLAADL